MRPLIAAEREDLHRGDIPRFTTRPNARDLWSAPDRCFPAVLHETGISMVRARLEQLGESDRVTQEWYIRASLATPAAGNRPLRRLTPPSIPVDVAADGEALDGCSGRCGSSWHFRWSRRCLVDRPHETERPNVAPGPLGADLYDGLPGVALFLAYLGQVTQEPRYSTLAKSALTALRRDVERSRAGTRPAITRIGAFTGWGGLIYALTHLGVLWQQPALDDAQAFVECLRPSLRMIELDIVEGTAGAITTLVCIRRSLRTHLLRQSTAVGICKPR